MKHLKLKSIALVAALIAAGQASAAILTSTATTTGGELFLSVWDQARQISYTRDLGITENDFLPGGSTAPIAGAIAFNPSATPAIGSGSVLAPGYTLNFGADPLLLQAFGSNLSGANYQILAEKAGANYSYLTTTLADASVMAAIPQSQVSQFRSGGDTYLAAVNLEGTHATQANGSSSTSDPNDPANVGKVLSSNWGGKTNLFDTTAPIGTALNFYQLSKGVGTGVNPATLGVFANAFGNSTWLLSADGTLTYAAAAAVPEPGTWALMAAGLLAVGAIARRRIAG